MQDNMNIPSEQSPDGHNGSSSSSNKKWKTAKNSFKLNKLRIKTKDEIQKTRELQSKQHTTDPSKTSDATSYLKARREKARKERQGIIMDLIDENINILRPSSPTENDVPNDNMPNSKVHDDKKKNRSSSSSRSGSSSSSKGKADKTDNLRKNKNKDDEKLRRKSSFSSTSPSKSARSKLSENNRLRSVLVNPFRPFVGARNNNNNSSRSSSSSRYMSKAAEMSNFEPHGILKNTSKDSMVATEMADDVRHMTSAKHSVTSRLADRRSISRRHRSVLSSTGTSFSDDPVKEAEMRTILEEVLRKYPKERCKTFADHQQFAFAELTTQSNHRGIDMCVEKLHQLKMMLESHLSSTLSLADEDDYNNERNKNKTKHDRSQRPIQMDSSKSSTDKNKSKKKATILRVGGKFESSSTTSNQSRSPKRTTSTSAAVDDEYESGAKSLCVPSHRHVEAPTTSKPSDDGQKRLNDSDTTCLTEPSTTEYDDEIPTLVPVVKLLLVDKTGKMGKYTGTIDINNGKPHGRGRFDYEDGGSYEGDWSSGSWSGYGRHLKRNGDVYEGNFVGNTKHGIGCYRYRDGRRKFEGKYVMGQRVDGQMIYGDGSKYDGLWSGGKRHGRGTYTFKDGSVYTGEFADDFIHGFGQLVWPDGAKYVGQWNQGHRHGVGKEYTPSGQLRYDGRWKESSPVSA